MYGGTGAPRARGPTSTRSCARSAISRPTRRSSFNRGSRSAIARTHPDAPRVLIANSLLVPAWATWDEFRALEAKGLTMYGQMTAGSWIYIGTQGILQGTYETFAEAARRHWKGTLRGRWTLTAGLGGMGGAQPLAVTMNEGVCLAVEVDPSRVARRVETRYVDKSTHVAGRGAPLGGGGRPRAQAALGRAGGERRGSASRALSPRRAARSGHRSDVRARRAERLRARRGSRSPRRSRSASSDPAGYVERALRIDGDPRPRHAPVPGRRAPSRSTTATTSAARRDGPASRTRSGFRGSCRSSSGRSSARGRDRSAGSRSRATPRTSPRPTGPSLELFPENEPLQRWIRLAGERVQFQGLPARICWLGMGERERFGEALHRLVERGEVEAPIVIGRDHLDCGSVASPYRETEAMRDGSDAIADWPILNALLNAVSGASWVSVHHGGGVGIGNSIHAGVVMVADGTPSRARPLEARPHERSRDRSVASRRRGLSGSEGRREEAQASDSARRMIPIRAGRRPFRRQTA